MKGLLMKDFCLTFKNRKLIGILLCMIVFVFFLQEDDMEGFIISFVTMLSSTLVLSTISIDEFDKSVMFLMTMPIKRSTYALEKYVFSFGCSFIGCTLATLFCCVMNSGTIVKTLEMAFVFLVITSLFQMLMIPVQLKYGGENGRMVLMGMVIAIMGIAFIAVRAGKMMYGEETLQKWFQGMLFFMQGLKPFYIILVVVIGWIICFLISTGISIRAVEEREY